MLNQMRHLHGHMHAGAAARAVQAPVYVPAFRAWSTTACSTDRLIKHQRPKDPPGT